MVHKALKYQETWQIPIKMYRIFKTLYFKNYSHIIKFFCKIFRDHLKLTLKTKWHIEI